MLNKWLALRKGEQRSEDEDGLVKLLDRLRLQKIAAELRAKKEAIEFELLTREAYKVELDRRRHKLGRVSDFFH